MKKKILIPLVLFVVFLIIYIIFNPIILTNPKYKLDKKYCEVDSDCVIRDNVCDGYINIYTYKKESDVTCDLYVPKPICQNNKCVSSKSFG